MATHIGLEAPNYIVFVGFDEHVTIPNKDGEDMV